MSETVHLRSDAGVSCTGLTSPRALGAAQTSLATQLLAAGTPGTNYFWTVEETARVIEAGDWTVSLRIEAGGPNQAQASVRCRVEHRNSSCTLLATLVDDTQGVGTSGTNTFTYSASVGQVTLSAGDRIVVRVERTNSTNRTATLRFANGSPDNSNLLHPETASDAEPVDAEVTHGLIVGHQASVTLEAAAEAAHALAVSHQLAAVVTDPQYLIFRRSPQTGEPFDPEVDTPIATTTNLTYPDTPGEGEYDYQVFATDGAGNYSSGSAVAQIAVGATAAEVVVDHRLTVQHAVAAAASVTAAAAHSLVVGHQVEAATQVTAEPSHALEVAHQATATAQAAADVAHRLEVTHQAQTSAAVTAEASHGLTLAHQASVQVGAEVTAALTHGLVLAHEAAIEASVTAQVAHRLPLSHQVVAQVGDEIAAVLAHGLIVAHQVTAARGPTDTAITHALTIRHQAEAAAEATAEASHALDLGHAAVVQVGGAVTATLTHGLHVAHQVEAERGPTETILTHSLTLTHQATATIGSAATAELTHALQITHTATAAVQVTAQPAHTLTVAHAATADASATAVIDHRLHLTHQLTATVPTHADITHQLVLAHQAAVHLGALLIGPGQVQWDTSHPSAQFDVGHPSAEFATASASVEWGP